MQFKILYKTMIKEHALSNNYKTPDDLLHIKLQQLHRQALTEALDGKLRGRVDVIEYHTCE